MKQLSAFIFLAILMLSTLSCSHVSTQKHSSLPSEELESEKQIAALEAETESANTLRDVRKKETQEELQRIQRSITEIDPVQS